MLKMMRLSGVLLACLVVLVVLVAGCSDDSVGGEKVECVAPEVFDPILGVCRLMREEPVGDVGGGVDVGADSGGLRDAGGDGGGESPVCEAGAFACLDDWTLGMCDSSGSGYTSVRCSENSLCRGGRCVEASGACQAGERTCESEGAALVCNGAGTGFERVACGAGELCHEGKCEAYVCVPDAVSCRGNQVVHCAADGSAEVLGEVCGSGQKCSDGACVEDLGPCADQKGYLGCEFFAVDLDHMKPGDAQQFGVTVSNSHSAPVNVRIYNGDGVLVVERTVGVEQLEVFELPRRDVENTGLTRQSYRIETNGPVTAHQFNPLNRSGVASTDASLLLPSYSLGTEYMVLGWPSLKAGIVTEGRGYFTIVAVRDGTEVTVKPNAVIEAGGGVAAMSAGETRVFSLERGQVLSLSTPNVSGHDLSGSLVSSTQPVAVFSGNECANVPLDKSACDHLEEQLFSVDHWGTTFVAAKFAPRGSENDVYRLIAQEDGTQVTFTPPLGSMTQITLNRGQVREFASKVDFVVEASKPVLLGQFMTGASTVGGVFSSKGDPAFLLNIATSQYESEYIVYVPAGFGSNYLNITAPAGAVIRLDGQVVAGSGAAIGTTNWRVFKPSVSGGIHRVVADRPVGLSVYGYDSSVSYAYPGGIALD